MRIDYSFVDGIWYATLCISECVTGWIHFKFDSDYNPLTSWTWYKRLISGLRKLED
jgi:hypothetical protein